ncbi:MAG: transglutaminase-like domain-containing protein [Myxococcales bacterium]|nr:transglutaminase domain-containing protein [Myxococcales bacterium]
MLNLVLALLVAQPTPSRRFRIEQTITVPAQPGPVTLWVPLPHDDEWQRVTSRVAGGEVVKDALGNEAARYRLPATGATLEVGYTVERRERSADLSRATGKGGGPARWLSDDKLVKVDDKVRAMAADITKDAKTPLERARAIYRYVLANMKYQKTGDGWGNGSIIWACTEKYGNCTDFHALFMGLSRASGIPARFEIGRSVPPDSGELVGYHCWADFWIDGAGWVPVDASEAWKHPEKREYFFGHHDADRFALSIGRDVTLPGMKGEPLNYFVNPYGELADGSRARDVKQTTRVTALVADAP